jgi:hypothetical protein
VNRLFFCLILFLAFGLTVGFSARAEELGAQKEPAQTADDFYRRALTAYLDGNYDKAILLTAQSLEKDPTHEKSRNLLAVLTSEKEREGKMVIWLAGKPTIISPTPVPFTANPFPDLGELPKDFKNLQTRVDRFYSAQMGKNAQTEGRIQVVQELVKTNSGAQYDEFRKSQTEVYNELKKINSSGNPDMRILYLLCGASLLFSLIALFRKSNK